MIKLLHKQELFIINKTEIITKNKNLNKVTEHQLFIERNLLAWWVSCWHLCVM